MNTTKSDIHGVSALLQMLGAVVIGSDPTISSPTVKESFTQLIKSWRN
jgi:hypothetical protein